MKNIKEMSVDELKILAYDLLVQSQQTQNSLKMVNQEIANRQINQEVETPKI